MQEPRISSRVFAVNDEPLGNIVSLEGCCFCLELEHGGKRVHLVRDCIFTIEAGGRVTLICMASAVVQYRCPRHSDNSAVRHAAS